MEKEEAIPEQLCEVNTDKEVDSETILTIIDKPNDSCEPQLSKRALKRKLKHEKWLIWKPIKRAKEKEKLKQKRQHARENNITLGPSRKALKLIKMENSSNKIRVCIDFSFDHLMTQKDICKCVKQFNRCYSLNRRATHPLQFYVSSFNNESKKEMERYNGYHNWDVNIHCENYLNIFNNKDDIIYLTSDSENIIEELNPNKIYIIGGIVDHNKYKNLTLNKALEENIQHGKLPINEYINMKTRQVLTINHVFEILLLKTSENLSWKDSLLKILPERKNISIKNNEDKINSNECEKEEQKRKDNDKEGEEEKKEHNEEEKGSKNIIEDINNRSNNVKDNCRINEKHIIDIEEKSQ